MRPEAISPFVSSQIMRLNVEMRPIFLQEGHIGWSDSKWSRRIHQPPMITVGHPGGRIFPIGLGIGATQAVCAVLSPTRAAGMPPTITVIDPNEIIPGPPGKQPTNMQGADISVTRAAGLPPISTVGHPLTIAKGIAGWGTGVGTGAAGCIGAWQ